MYRPWLSGRVGVEMEISHCDPPNSNADPDAGRSVPYRIRRQLRIAGVQQVEINDRDPGYYHSNGRTWDVKTDSSCGWELATPALQLDERGRHTQLERVCDALRSSGMKVSTNCGLHQHHEVPGYDWQALQRLVALWCRYEPFLYEIMPSSRRENSYCAPLARNSWTGQSSRSWRTTQALLTARTRTQFDMHGGRMPRAALHISGWWRNERIEVRLHQGTIDAQKIEFWAMFTKAMINRVLRTDMPEVSLRLNEQRSTVPTTEYICKQLGLLPSSYVPDVPPESITLVGWLKARRMRFNPSYSEPVRPASTRGTL